MIVKAFMRQSLSYKPWLLLIRLVILVSVVLEQAFAVLLNAGQGLFQCRFNVLKDIAGIGNGAVLQLFRRIVSVLDDLVGMFLCLADQFTFFCQFGNIILGLCLMLEERFFGDNN